MPVEFTLKSSDLLTDKNHVRKLCEETTKQLAATYARAVDQFLRDNGVTEDNAHLCEMRYTSFQDLSGHLLFDGKPIGTVIVETGGGKFTVTCKPHREPETRQDK